MSDTEPSKKETYLQFAKRIFGDCTSDQADLLLWHCTAFPCINLEELETQLTQVRLDSGGDFALAMKQADEVMEKAMKGLNKEQNG